ncbi:hypothetical protein SMMN14_08441 [Sphaerulina musiva]
MRMTAGALVVAFLGLDLFGQLLMTQILSHHVLNVSSGRLRTSIYDFRRQMRRKQHIVPGTCSLVECEAYWFAVDQRTCTDRACPTHYEIVG